MSLYDECVALPENDSTDEVLSCVTLSLQQGLDAFFLLVAMALVFIMQAGFAMICAGCVRSKNVNNTMLKNFLDAAGAAIGFWSVGYAFAYGGSTADGIPTTFIGNTNFFLMNISEDFFLAPEVNPEIYWLFQFAFAATSATIVAGTLAERCQMAAYLCYSMALTGFVYPVVAHSVWSPNGWLSPFNPNRLFGVGMIDFAGSGVVHMTGGVTAIMAAQILGPRRGRFYDNRGNPLPEAEKFDKHSSALQVLGTFLLWFGWYGFNPGSALQVSSATLADIVSHSAVTTTLAAAAASISAMITNLIYLERTTGEAVFDIDYALNGALSGLVAITAGSVVIEIWASVVVGIIAGWVFMLSSKLLIRFRIDDAVDAIPVHFANGMWGCLQVGFFATEFYMDQVYGDSTNIGWFYEWSRGSANGRLLAAQLVGMLFICGWVLLIMFPFFFLLNYLGLFRADSLEEVVGLDISYHGGKAVANDESLEYVEAMKVHKSLSETKTQRKTDDNGSHTLAETISEMAMAQGYSEAGGPRSKHMSEIISEMIGAASEIEHSEYEQSEFEQSEVDSNNGSQGGSDVPGNDRGGGGYDYMSKV